MKLSSNYSLLAVGISLILLFSTQSVYAQFPDTQEDESYLKEWAFGLMMNTHGGLIGGVSLRHARKLFFTRTVEQSLGVNSGKTKSTTLSEGYLEKWNHYHSFSLEIMNVKHPKEFTDQFRNGKSFCPYKKNYLITIRPQYGREIILFRKAREQGVQVSWIFSGGPSIGLVAPYLVQVGGKWEQYDSEKHGANYDNVEDVGSFFNSIGRSEVKLGLAVKTSMAFEFGVSKTSISGVEVGLLADVFFSGIEIMDNHPAESFYPAMFLTFFFGNRK